MTQYTFAALLGVATSCLSALAQGTSADASTSLSGGQASNYEIKRLFWHNRVPENGGEWSRIAVVNDKNIFIGNDRYIHNWFNQNGLWQTSYAPLDSKSYNKNYEMKGMTAKDNYLFISVYSEAVLEPDYLVYRDCSVPWKGVWDFNFLQFFVGGGPGALTSYHHRDNELRAVVGRNNVEDKAKIYSGGAGSPPGPVEKLGATLDLWNNVRSIAVDPSGTYLAGPWLYKLKAEAVKGGKVDLLAKGDGPYAVAVDMDNAGIYIADRRSIGKYDSTNNKLGEISLPKAIDICIKDGTLYALTADGVYSVNLNGD